jgi:ribosomal protein S12
VVLIRNLARAMRSQGGRGHGVTPLTATPDRRGYWFEVHLTEDRQPTGRVARVTVTLDRVYRYCATHGRQHDDDGDPTCRWE